jgi:Arc/MetJ-type ribon-helix-helix transcriptional regulator
MDILSVKVENETMEKLENLVEKKMYWNKSEAIRKILEEHLGIILSFSHMMN